MVKTRLSNPWGQATLNPEAGRLVASGEKDEDTGEVTVYHARPAGLLGALLVRGGVLAPAPVKRGRGRPRKVVQP